MWTKLFRSEAAASLVDQAAVSGGNFLTALVLARILVPAEYGVFSLLFLALFAINTCHSSLVIYPLTLRGAENPASLVPLTCSALVHTVLLAAPLAAVLGLVAVALHQAFLWPVLALAMLAWQLQETTRRALLSNLRFHGALLPDALCYLGQGCILAVLQPHRLATVFLVVALTSVAAAAWQFAVLATGPAASLRGLPAALPEWSRRHGVDAWRLGRFVLAGNALNMLTLQVPSWALTLAFAPAAAAGYQSLLNLAGVANPIIFSANSMLIPLVAREAARGFRHARQTALRHGLRVGALLVPVFLVFAIAPHAVMRLAYGAASPYLPLAWLLRLFVAAFAMQYLATVVGAYEGGMSRPETYMRVQVVSSGFLLTAGIWMIYRYGLPGAVIAMLVASTLRLLAFLLCAHSADSRSMQLVPVHAASTSPTERA